MGNQLQREMVSHTMYQPGEKRAGGAFKVTAKHNESEGGGRGSLAGITGRGVVLVGHNALFSSSRNVTKEKRGSHWGGFHCTKLSGLIADQTNL